MHEPGDRSLKSTTAAVSVGLVLLVPLAAMAQSAAHHTPFQAPSLDLSLQEECDSDLNGALIGAAIGVSPAILAFIIQDEEEAQAALGIGIIGGVVGFVAGLAVDSSNCSATQMNRLPQVLLDEDVGSKEKLNASGTTGPREP